MRTLLRRRIQEQTADQWQDADLNELLNEGAREVQRRLIHIDPMCVAYIDVADLVSGQELYAHPAGFLYEYALKIYDVAAQKYKRIGRDDEEELRDVSDTAS